MKLQLDLAPVLVATTGAPNDSLRKACSRSFGRERCTALLLRHALTLARGALVVRIMGEGDPLSGHIATEKL